MKYYPKKVFEEQLSFRQRDGTDIGDIVLVGNAEFLPKELLNEFELYEEEFYSWIHNDWRMQQSERRNAILDLPHNMNRYYDLQAAVTRKQVVPFIGSGMSVPSGIPTWSDFLKSLGEYVSCDSSELNQLICASFFEEAADLIASSTNPRLFAERIEHSLRIGDTAIVYGPVGLLPELFSNLVITTNLDEVLEHLYEESGMSFEHVLSGTCIAEYRQVKNPQERFLLKMHGDYRSQKDRVLLSEEYREVYQEGSIVYEEISLLFRTNSLLFLGCSLREDRTVGLIEAVSNTDKNMPKHFALLPTPETKTLRINREEFLTQKGIYPIWYELPHDDAIMALLEGLYDWNS